jgi:hypothetical protein
LDKILIFLELREVDRGAGLQNIRTKGLIGKILQNKELAEVRRWRRGVAAFPLDCVDALRTFPVWAFHILGKGRSSQEGGILLWRAVEKV